MSVKLDEVLNSNPLDYRMAEVRSDSRVIERSHSNSSGNTVSNKSCSPRRVEWVPDRDQH